jgi:ribosomal protein S18 acetylase RimI-like enzyme
VLYAFDLERDLPDVPSDLALDVRPLTEEEIDAYLALRPDEDADTVHAQLRRGDLCVASWSGDRMVGAVWVRFDRIWVSELARTLAVRPGEAYGYNAFIQPEHRRHGAAKNLYVTTMRRLESLGYRRVLVYVDAQNVAGRAPLWRLGFEHFGRIRWFHLGRLGLELLSRRDERTRLRIHVRAARPQE